MTEITLLIDTKHNDFYYKSTSKEITFHFKQKFERYLSEIWIHYKSEIHYEDTNKFVLTYPIKLIRPFVDFLEQIYKQTIR